ncbi:2520_t:CDS:2, partial [Racocetra fulgida]
SGDIAKLLQHFEKERTKNPDWYIQPLIDSETNRLQSVFYISPEQQELWQSYADIILNDNIASTNTYNLLLSIFTIVHPSTFIIDTDLDLEKFHVIQINETMMYNSQKVDFNDLFYLILDIVESGPIELEYDFCQIYFDRLLEEYKDEMMNISVIDEPFVKEKLQVYKDTTLDASSILLFSTVAESWNAMSIETPKQIAEKVIGQSNLLKEHYLDLHTNA